MQAFFGFCKKDNETQHTGTSKRTDIKHRKKAAEKGRMHSIRFPLRAWGCPFAPICAFKAPGVAKLRVHPGRQHGYILSDGGKIRCPSAQGSKEHKGFSIQDLGFSIQNRRAKANRD